MKAIEKAVSYLNIKPRTIEQVKNYLKSKDYDESEIAEAIKELEEYHYLDDLEFSKLYFELGFEKGRGVARIRRELTEKGVDRDTIDKAYDLLDNIPDAYEMAYEIGQKVLLSKQIPEDYHERQKLQARIVRKLATRGFTGDIAYRVAKELLK